MGNENVKISRMGKEKCPISTILSFAGDIKDCPSTRLHCLS
jgi:hypothetical protein